MILYSIYSPQQTTKRPPDTGLNDDLPVNSHSVLQSKPSETLCDDVTHNLMHSLYSSNAAGLDDP